MHYPWVFDVQVTREEIDWTASAKSSSNGTERFVSLGAAPLVLKGAGFDLLLVFLGTAFGSGPIFGSLSGFDVSQTLRALGKTSPRNVPRIVYNQPTFVSGFQRP